MASASGPAPGVGLVPVAVASDIDFHCVASEYGYGATGWREEQFSVCVLLFGGRFCDRLDWRCVPRHDVLCGDDGGRSAGTRPGIQVGEARLCSACNFYGRLPADKCGRRRATADPG